MSYYFSRPTQEEAKDFYQHVIRKHGETRWVFRFRNIGRTERDVLNALNKPSNDN